MDDGVAPLTSASLLGRLRCLPYDQLAWNEFVDRYSRPIYGWCRRWHLQPADAEDVTQAVLLLLARKMSGFAYDPGRSFRCWLKTLVHHACSDFFSSRFAREGAHGVLGPLASVEARRDLEQHLKQEFDLELLDEALARVQARVAPRTWQAFYLSKIEGRAPLDVAGRLELSVARVYVYASRVLRMIQAEVRQLDGNPLPLNDMRPPAPASALTIA